MAILLSINKSLERIIEDNTEKADLNYLSGIHRECTLIPFCLHWI